jgi:hypothetical protein
MSGGLKLVLAQLACRYVTVSLTSCGGVLQEELLIELRDSMCAFRHVGASHAAQEIKVRAFIRLQNVLRI